MSCREAPADDEKTPQLSSRACEGSALPARRRPSRADSSQARDHIRGLRLLRLSCLLALGACGADSDASSPPAAVEVDTLGGIVHVTFSGPGAWATGSPWRVDTARAVTIGAIEGPEASVFGQVAGVVVGRDGRIYVADAQAKEVRIFSAGGEFLSRFGRDGEGPGEFRNISGLGRGPGGGIATLDPALGRVSIFGPDGEFIRSFRLHRPHVMISSGAPVRYGRDGRYHDLTKVSRGAGADSLAVIRYDAEGVVDDTVLLSVFQPELLTVMRNGLRQATLTMPQSPRAMGAVGPGGEIYAALGGDYRISELGTSGDTVRVLRRTVEPLPIPPAGRDSLRDVLIERYTQVAGEPPREAVPVPVRMPALLALEVDETDHLWVLRPTVDPAGMEWDVFDPEGGYLGAVSLPAMFVMHIGERSIAGVVYDEMGVQRVRVYPLER